MPPGNIDDRNDAYGYVVRLDDGEYKLRFVERSASLVVQSQRRFSKRAASAVESIARRMFRLDDDLAPFYAMIRSDEQLSWATAGAGRMLASPTVFEDVIRTVCTTNCAWSATTRMIDALVGLGEGAFPSPQLLAKTKDAWFTDVARMGYRGPYIRAIARDVAGGLDLEALLPRRGLDDDEVEERLLAMPGVGPYAAAHIMQLLGYHRRLILDSWTRPTFLKLSGMKRATDTTIRRRFSRYGAYAGLAFWLFLTRRWHEESG